MANSIRRPARIYGLAMWALSAIFAAFLIGLGGLVIADLPKVDRSVSLEDYVDQSALDAIAETRVAALELRSGLNREREDAEADLEAARQDVTSAQIAFDAWLATRAATRDSTQNPDVIARTRALEALERDVQSERTDLARIEQAITAATRTIDDANAARTTRLEAARPTFQAAMQSQALKVFAMRLALTLPLLIVAGFLVARTRKSQYWPLYRGFVMFALFAFFVELVPYLPSYGGYVRYGVGIIATLVAGHFIIRGMRRYLARQRTAEVRSESDRRKSIAYETALKKLAAKTCPGCDRSIYTRDGEDTDFCVHCGIRLQEDCQSCGTTNLSFHKFCIACGTPSAAETELPRSPVPT